jgi:hypothetical protein
MAAMISRNVVLRDALKLALLNYIVLGEVQDSDIESEVEQLLEEVFDDMETELREREMRVLH